MPRSRDAELTAGGNLSSTVVGSESSGLLVASVICEPVYEMDKAGAVSGRLVDSGKTSVVTDEPEA